ncbi:MAG TPA: helix-turn-helix transcriptional regulator [Vicinamibacterales bacterium]
MLRMQMRKFGQVVRDARVRHGWSQAVLHVRSGVSIGDISRVECGRLAPSRQQMARLAEALDLPSTDTDVTVRTRR